MCSRRGLARGRSLAERGQVLCAQAVALGVGRKRGLSELWTLSPCLSDHRAPQRRSPLDPGEDRGMGGRDRALSGAGRSAWRDVEYAVRSINDHGIDLARGNSDGTWRLPMPARFVIDRTGVIRAADVDPDYTKRTEPAETVAVLRTLNR